jgi:drug/metabolite transporter (DMT)-like permease
MRTIPPTFRSLDRMRQREAAVGLLAIAAAWGMIGVIVRWVALPAVVVVCARTLLAAATIGAASLVHLGPRRAQAALHVPRPLAVVGLGLLLAVHWTCLFAAQQRAPVGTVLLITYMAPVLVAALAPRLLHEHVPASTVAALVVAMAGIVLLVRPEPGQGDGIVLAVAAAVSYAGITLTSKHLVGDVGGVRLAFAHLGVAGLAMLPLAVAADWGEPSWSWAWLLVVGVVLTGILGPLYLVLLGRLPAATVGVLTYVEPVSAVILAWVFLGERPSPATVAGGTLVVAAGIMVVAATGAAARQGSVARVPGR